MTDRRQHWETAYRTRSELEVSWFRPRLDVSLAIIERLQLDPSAAILDVGGGASTLADDLLARGFRQITVLDLSPTALTRSQDRLGEAAGSVEWICCDLFEVSLPEKRISLWHDRAVFHFLTEPADRARYRSQLEHALASSGHVLIATFSLEGPQRCSGLEVCRYSIESLHRELGSGFDLVEAHEETHQTPSGASQEFLYGLFRRR